MKARDPADLGFVLEFLRLLWAVDHGLQSTSKRMLAEHGVTALQRMIVRIVGRFPTISAGGLAALLHVHPSTITGALDKLVRAGAISRTADPTDARRAVLTLRKPGKVIDAISEGTVEAAVAKVLPRFTSQEIESSKRILNAIAQELDALAPSSRG